MTRDAHVERTVSDYREFPTPSSLKRHVLCLWTQTIADSQRTYAHRVLPDGCIDIVFINGAPPVVVGPWTETFIAHLAPGTTIVGARFHPGCAPSLLRLPVSALLNQSVALHEVSHNALLEQFERIADESNLSAKRSALEASLFNCLAGSVPIDDAVSATIQWLARHPQGRVEELSGWIGLSSRQLQRRFSASVGYGPKTFQSVLRFQRFLNLAGGKRNGRTLAHLAADAGYADQAHMTREVHRFSGTRPSVLLRSAECTLRMSDFFKTVAGDALCRQQPGGRNPATACLAGC